MGALGIDEVMHYLTVKQAPLQPYARLGKSVHLGLDAETGLGLERIFQQRAELFGTALFNTFAVSDI